MKKVFGSTSEVCHVWASRSQSEGRSGNVFFDGDTIFSYGRHFPIARHLSHNKVLLTTRGYSISTSSHIRKVRNAINHKLIVFCENPELSIQKNIDLEKDNIEVAMALIAATKHKKRIENLTASLHHIVSGIQILVDVAAEVGEAAEFPEWAKLSEDIKADAERFAARVAEEKARRIAAAEAAEAEALADEKDKLRAWKRGDHLRLNPHLAHKLPVALRVNGDHIETSHGARIPVASVTPELWAAINDARTKGLTKFYDLNFQLGHYKVDLIEADGTLVAGCHRIKYSELKRMAGALFGVPA